MSLSCTSIRDVYVPVRHAEHLSWQHLGQRQFFWHEDHGLLPLCTALLATEGILDSAAGEGEQGASFSISLLAQTVLLPFRPC